MTENNKTGKKGNTFFIYSTLFLDGAAKSPLFRVKPMIEGSPNYALHNLGCLIEHSLTLLTPSPKLRPGEGEPQSGRLELTPLPPGDGVPDLAKQERGEGRESRGEGNDIVNIYTCF
jgi:hypothetical protein